MIFSLVLLSLEFFNKQSIKTRKKRDILLIKKSKIRDGGEGVLDKQNTGLHRKK